MAYNTDPKKQSCIEACNRCYQTCLQDAMNRCLESGGKHVAPEHMHLMLNCAEICQTSVNFMLSNSAFSSQICKVCAEICDACAKVASRWAAWKNAPESVANVPRVAARWPAPGPNRHAE